MELLHFLSYKLVSSSGRLTLNCSFKTSLLFSSHLSEWEKILKETEPYPYPSYQSQEWQALNTAKKSGKVRSKQAQVLVLSALSVLCYPHTSLTPCEVPCKLFIKVFLQRRTPKTFLWRLAFLIFLNFFFCIKITF